MTNDQNAHKSDPRPSIDEERIMQALKAALAQHDAQLREHVRSEIKTVDDQLKSAFPSGDVHGHRIAHEAQIKRANRWDDIRAEFISKAFTSGSLAAMGFLLLLVWEYIKSGGQK